MRQYTTVELARFVEHDVQHNLSRKREQDGSSSRFLPVFEIYRRVANEEYGSQITAGFFSKILSDLRKTGVIVTQDGGKSIALSEDAWKVKDEFNNLRVKFETVVGELIECGVFKDGEAVARYLRSVHIPLGVEIRFYDGPAETFDPELDLPIIEDRYLDLALGRLKHFSGVKEKITSTSASTEGGK